MVADEEVRAALGELARWRGFAGTPDMTKRLGWTADKTRRVFREAESRGLVTSKRGGGMSYGRPLWWSLTEAGRREATA